jgi:hypothetical protein
MKDSAPWRKKVRVQDKTDKMKELEIYPNKTSNRCNNQL